MGLNRRSLRVKRPKLTAAERAARSNQWSQYGLQPLLITIAAVSLAIGFLSVARVIAPSLPWFGLIPITLVVALEAIFTTLWLTHERQIAMNRLAYRGAEFILVVVLTRLYTWLIAPDRFPVDSVRALILEPLTLINDLFFLLAVVLALIIWQRVGSLARIFKELAISAAEIEYYALSAFDRKWADKPPVSQRGWQVASYFRQWLQWGIVLILCTALASFNLPEIVEQASTPQNVTRLGLHPALLWGLIAYFLSGFVLLSQARLAEMNALWLAQAAVKSPQVERAWHRHSSWALLLIAIAAVFLPLGSTGVAQPFFQMLVPVLEFLFKVMLAIITLITSLFTLLLSLIFSLLPAPPEGQAAPPAYPSTLPLPPPAPAEREPNMLATLIANSAIWTVLIVALVLGLAYFFRYRQIPRSRVAWQEALQNGWQAFCGSLSSWLLQLFADFSIQFDEARQSVQARLYGSGAEERKHLRPFSFLRINSLSSKEQIRYFYLSILERTRKQGLPRPEPETPLEFATQLKENWPDAAANIDSLTESFLQARYSDKPVADAAASSAKLSWKQLRRNIRKRKRQRSSEQ